MSEQDNTPPSEDNAPGQQQPPVEPASGSSSESIAENVSETVSAAAESAAAAVGSATEPPPGGGATLGLGKSQPSEEKTMGMLAHILGGVTNIIGPLIIWLIKKEDSPFVDDQGKEALNFQITIMIGYVASAILTMVPVIGCVFSLLYVALIIVSLVFAIIGGLAANKGEVYRYPFALRFVK